MRFDASWIVGVALLTLISHPAGAHAGDVPRALAVGVDAGCVGPLDPACVGATVSCVLRLAGDLGHGQVPGNIHVCD